MKLIPKPAIAFLLMTVPGAYAQTISGISGNISHGSYITINGSSFGTKAVAAPVKWDNFERGSNGRALSTADGWDSVDGWNGTSSSNLPYYSNVPGQRHSGNLGMTCPYKSDTYNASVLKRANFSTGFYLDAWYRYAPANPASRNHKLFMLYGTGANELPQTALTGFCHLDESLVIPFYAGPNTGDADWPGLTFNHLIGQMRHIQVWIKPSTPGVRDGQIWLAVDGTVYSNRSDMLTVMPEVGYWNQARIGYYMAHAGVADCADAGDAYTHWDDLYIDNTQARVEIGNAPTYAASTHREIQIPTTWAQNQIGVNVNLGSFQPGSQLYLFVVNAEGRASPGHAFSLNPGSDSLAPAAPSNLRSEL